MTNKQSQLSQLFMQSNKEMKHTIRAKLLLKNKIKTKVKSLSKTTILTLVALLGATVFSVSFAALLFY